MFWRMCTQDLSGSKNVNPYNNLRMQVYKLGLPMISQLPKFVSSIAELSKQQKQTNFDDKGSDQESFQPDFHHLKKLGLKVNKKKIQVGGWSAVENQIYLKFMMDNPYDFSTQKARRTTKVFYRLSKILKRRTPDQCRSHHQKLQIKCQDDLNDIMQEVFKKIQRTIAEDFVNEQHRLHRPSFLNFKQNAKAQTPELENPQTSDHLQKKQSSLNWHNIEISKSNIKIQIIEENVKVWNLL